MLLNNYTVKHYKDILKTKKRTIIYSRSCMNLYFFGKNHLIRQLILPDFFGVSLILYKHIWRHLKDLLNAVYGSSASNYINKDIKQIIKVTKMAIKANCNLVLTNLAVSYNGNYKNINECVYRNKVQQQKWETFLMGNSKCDQLFFKRNESERLWAFLVEWIGKQGSLGKTLTSVQCSEALKVVKYPVCTKPHHKLVVT